ncbi:MAG: AAA family ATPase [Clostridia bacterium]|nr:AAA family ATPase [Clostridia bacterium]
MLEELKIKDSIPKLVMLVGVPASGKSTITEKLASLGYLVLSSDKIRSELYDLDALFSGDRAEMKKANHAVFNKIASLAKEGLSQGKSVLIDATNLNRKNRIYFLRGTTKLLCERICVLVVTPPDICLERNAKRQGAERLPEAEMHKMIGAFECPIKNEGWDKILLCQSSEPYSLPLDLTIGFNQDNPNHAHTLYEHLRLAEEYAIKNNYSKELVEICLYHDIGKLFTKKFQNHKGEKTDIAHYLCHEGYGAYMYLASKCCGNALSQEELEEACYFSALIGAHMRPLHVWNKSENARKRDLSIFGNEFIFDLEKVSRADLFAH